jgi:hypothetical protein
MTEANLTERQRKWFESVRASLERDTGRSLAEWVAIARDCPESGHRARLKWLKDNHGLLQNHASHVLDEAFGGTMPWQDPQAMIDALWTDPASRTILEALDRAARTNPDVIQTARKGYTAWSRKVQFAAARPVKGGKAMLGVAAPPESSARLEAPRKESWSERLKARTLISAPSEVDSEIEALLQGAWSRA